MLTESDLTPLMEAGDDITILPISRIRGGETGRKLRLCLPRRDLIPHPSRSPAIELVY